MKKLVRILGWLLGLVVLVAIAVRLFVHETRPTGTEGPAADQLAQAMIESVDGDAWHQTRWLRWSFADRHHYVWDKERDFVQVSWDNNVVKLKTKTLDGQALQLGMDLSGNEKQQALEKAWSNFCNDSYWLNPIVKAFDPGTTRSVVSTEQGKGVMITHGAGGTTPGDSYLYLLDDSNRPTAWKMWVSIIPIGGIEVSWDGWEELPGGAWVSSQHGIMGKTFTMISDLGAGQDFADLGLQHDPFADL